MRADRSFWNETTLIWPPVPGTMAITISEWQEADGWHRACYDEGGVVIELDEDEKPVRSFAKDAP